MDRLENDIRPIATSWKRNLVACAIGVWLAPHATCLAASTPNADGDGATARGLKAYGRYGRDASAKSARTWAVSRFIYKAENKRLTDLLQDFASSEGLPLIIAPGVDGVVQGDFDATPEAFLNAMSKTFGIIWYHDGSALYIYPSGAIQSRLFRLKGFSRSRVEKLLASLELGDTRFPLKFDTSENTLLVYGPPRHVDLVGAALESLDAGVTDNNRKQMRVFALKFASAADRTYGDTRVPGMAATLRQAYGAVAPPDAMAPGTAPSAVTSKLSSLPGLNGNKALDTMLGNSSAKNPTATTPGDKSSFGLSARGMTPPDADNGADVVFQADEATNSIIVYGPASHMDEYAKLIEQLDINPTLVEIEATIIDVDSNSVEELGVTWSASGAKGSVSLSSPVSGSAGAMGQLASGTFAITTLWQNAGRELLSRVEALSTQGKAKIIARPKVLGVANRAAVMGNKRIAAVRVAGNLEANLFQVEAGTQLQVTPQIVKTPTNQVKLSIYIQDGDFEQTSVDQVPIVRRTEISTEAHMNEGESVLIGGITSDTSTTQDSGVPGLSRLPLIGGLFRWKGTNTEHTERLFLITPRVVHEALEPPDSPAMHELRGLPMLMPMPMPAPLPPAAAVPVPMPIPLPVQPLLPAPRPVLGPVTAPAAQPVALQVRAAPAEVAPLAAPESPPLASANPADVNRHPQWAPITMAQAMSHFHGLFAQPTRSARSTRSRHTTVAASPRPARGGMTMSMTMDPPDLAAARGKGVSVAQAAALIQGEPTATGVPRSPARRERETRAPRGAAVVLGIEQSTVGGSQ